MKAIALLANDLHITSSCIDDFNLNWDEMLEQCEANDVSSCVIGGDLFTNRSSQSLDVLMAVKRAIEKAQKNDITLFIALGNHDLLDQEATYGYPSLYSEYGNVVIIDNEPLIIPFGGIDSEMKLVVMRYWKEATTFPAKLEELRNKLKEMDFPESKCILYVHEGIAGGLGDFVAPGEIPNDMFKGFYRVLAAHYHFRKKIKGSNVEYIGSTRQKSHGEEGAQGYTLLFDDGTYSFIENQVNTRYITFQRKFDELNDKLLDEIRDYRDDDYRVRLILECTEAQAKTVDKQMLFDAGVTKYEALTEEAVQEKITDEDLSKKFDKQGIQDEYENYCDDKNISSKLGMKYLNMI